MPDVTKMNFEHCLFGTNLNQDFSGRGLGRYSDGPFVLTEDCRCWWQTIDVSSARRMRTTFALIPVGRSWRRYAALGCLLRLSVSHRLGPVARPWRDNISHLGQPRASASRNSPRSVETNAIFD